MTKLAAEISQKTGIEQPSVEKILESFQSCILSSLKIGERVVITEFVSFGFKDFPERQRRNPKTQETVTVPAIRQPRAKFSKAFIEAIQPGSAPVANPEPSPEPSPEPVMPIALPPLPAEFQVSEPELEYYLQDGYKYSKEDIIKKNDGNLVVFIRPLDVYKRVKELFPEIA